MIRWMVLLLIIVLGGCKAQTPPVQSFNESTYLKQDEYTRWHAALQATSSDVLFKDVPVQIEDVAINGEVDYNSPIAAYKSDSGDCTLFADPVYKTKHSGLVELSPIGTRRIWTEVLVAHELGHCQEQKLLTDKQAHALRIGAMFDADIRATYDRFIVLREARADLVALGYCKVRYPNLYREFYNTLIKMRSDPNLAATHQTIKAIQLAGPDMVVQGTIFENADRIIAEL